MASHLLLPKKVPFVLPWGPHKPYILPKPKLGVAKAMTICAGFRCQDGVVLCADTQITSSGWYKSRAKKIVSALNDTVFFAFAAEDVRLTRAAIRRLSVVIKYSKPGTATAFEQVLRKECRAIKKEFGRKFYLSLLVVLRTRAQAILYEIAGTDISEVREACIGTGLLVVQRILSSYLKDSRTMQEACFVGAYLLAEAIDHGDAVGPPVQILKIPHAGDWDTLQDSEVENLFRTYREVQESIGKILTTYCPFFRGYDDVDAELKILCRLLRKAYKTRGHLIGVREEARIDEYLRTYGDEHK